MQPNSSLYKVKSYKKFQYKEKVTVNLLLENIDLKSLLENNYKKYFGGTWYVTYYPQLKIINKVFRNSQDSYKFVNKSKFNLVRYGKSSENLKQTITDVTPYVQYINSRFRPVTSNFDQVFQYIANPDHKSILLYVVTDLNPVPTIQYTKIYNILRKIYMIQKDLSNYILPDEFIVNLKIKGRDYFVTLVENNDWSNIRIVLTYLKSLLNRVTTKVDKNSEVVNLASVIVKEEDNESVENNETDELHTEVKINKAVNLVSRVDTKKIDSKLPEKEKIFKVKKEIVTKTIPKSIDKNKVNYSKVINKTLANTITPEEVNLDSPLPITSKDIDSKRLVSVDYMKDEYNELPIIFKKMFSSFKNSSQYGFGVTDVYVSDYKERSNKIQDSELIKVVMKLEFPDNSVHTIDMIFPKLKPDGTLRVNGNDYYIASQLIPIPITFPKKYEGRFFSNTVALIIDKTETNMMIKVAGERLPLGLVLTYVFGLDTMFNKLGIKYHYSETKTSLSIKLSDTKFIAIDSTLNDKQKLFLNGLAKYDLSIYTNEPFTENWWKEVFESITGNDNTSRYISDYFKIALDNRTLEILKSKSLPTNMLDIMDFMMDKIISGYSTSRNDLREMRFRSYESLVQVALDRIKIEVSNYNRMKKYGKTDAKFNIDKERFIKDILSSPAVNIMYKVNPVHELEQLQKVTYSGYKGIPSDAVPANLRGLDMTYYGVIDPVATTEGGTTGVNQSLTFNPPIVSKLGTIIPYDIDNEDVNILSVTTSLAPFISKTEPTRGLFISNHVKQALPLVKSEPAAVLTGYEAVVPNLTSTFSDKSPCNGKVVSVSDTKIEILCDNSKEPIKIDIKPFQTRSNVGIFSYITPKPRIKANDKVKKGDILTNNEFIKDGILTLGKNFLTSYIFWKGKNYEDGIVISDSIVDDLTVSVSSSLFMYIDEDAILNRISLDVGKEVNPGDILLDIVSTKLYEYIEIGLLNEDDIFIESNKFKLVVPFKGVIKSYEIYLNSKKVSRDMLNKLNKYKVNYQDAPFKYKNMLISGVFIRVNIVSQLPAELGDKMTNRAAAKGVITYIEKKENMPVLPDGRIVEILINPLSVINRTNMNQLYELYCGEISYQLTKIARSDINKLNHIYDKFSKLPDIDYINKALYEITKKKNKDLISYIKENYFPIVIPPFKEPNYKPIQEMMKVLNIPNKYKVYLPEYDKHIEAPVGYEYFYRLHHLSSIKVHSRSIGTYDPKTGQPLGGKKLGGGLRVGEFDEWALINYEANNLVDELYSFGSDNQNVKRKMYREIIETGSTNLREIKQEQSKTNEYLKYLFLGIMLNLN